MNNITLIGRLTKDPEVRTTADDNRLAVLRLAIPRRKSGEDAGAVFVNVVCFGRQAEAADEYLYRGRRVAVEGRLEQREWTDSDGEARSRHEVIAERLEFLDARHRPEAADLGADGGKPDQD
ncbi:MAG TPA: single-stranded DNA-binding protein [Acidimicrobiales bacterium]|nr:single-stranded DNA-binding protein [Acidimicrobiales bacterium]